MTLVDLPGYLLSTSLTDPIERMFLDGGIKRVNRGLYLTGLNFDYWLSNRGVLVSRNPFGDVQRALWQSPFAKKIYAGDDVDPAERQAHVDYAASLMEGPQDFGVCDDPDQVLTKWPELHDDPRNFVISFTRMDRDVSNKYQGGGWRWHKWGEYIGTQTPTEEYLDDEPLIDHIYCFHIHEVLIP